MSRIIAFIHLTLDGVMQTRRRPFTDGGPSAKLRLVDSNTTTKGAVIATYQPERTSGRAA